ncbi:MAG: putative toxin-antitoxin system toxin component, PIN family [Halobacteriales archaeon]
MGTLRVVYDTNVLVSALGWGGTPWEALLPAFIRDVEMVTSDAALDEFERVLGYGDLPFTDDEQARFPELVRFEASIVDPAGTITAVEEDPDDDVFLEIATEANADYLVSGDPHLTDLGEFRGTPIVSPAAFLQAGDTPDLG